MYAGEVVETGPVEDIFLQPAHPYTQALIRCVPQIGMSKQEDCLQPIRGQVPSPDDLPSGCLFEPRCPFARAACAADHPHLKDISATRTVRCPFTQSLGSAAPQDAGERSLSAPAVVPGSSDEILLRAEHVKTYYEHSSNSLAGLFGLGEKEYVKAVDDISFDLPKGSTLGIVGESGCGKSTLAKTIVGLEPLTDGRIGFLGFDISVPVRKRDLELIQAVQMVFQNPDSTLNPSFKVGYQIGRPLVCFGDVPRSNIQQEVQRLLEAVRLDKRYADRLPRQLSGGEKQRVAIARALAARPDLVVCDEPVSSLDVSVQAAVLNLLLKAQQESNTTLLFIAHDLSVVRFISDFIGVMYLGKIAEIGSTEKIYRSPYHPYTEALLSAVPIPNPRAQQKHIRLSGSVPSALQPPSGCRFHTRCPRKLGAICERQKPPARRDGSDHVIYCHIPMRDLRKVDPVVNTAS
jgi:peptide/nickel transport system ATP-binding protein